jgi:peptide/nickel transport system permease protein
MLRFIVRRLLWFIPTVLFVTFLVYVAVRIGWDPVQTYVRANPRASDEQIARYREVNGLYDGFGGYVRGYFEWLWAFVQGPDSWPGSIKGGGEVYPTLRYSLFNTLRLAGTAATLGIGIGLFFGVVAGKRPGSWIDGLVNSIAFFVGSIPPFVSAIILQLAFAVQLGWLPAAGIYPPGHQGFDPWLLSKHMVLPVFVVSIQVIGNYTRYMRASLLDVSSADYLRTARAKGLSERQVLRRHTIRNSLIPIATVVAIDIGAILGGLIITENIFNYPGMGVFFIDAANDGDFPRLMPFLVIITLSVLIFNLLADLSYAYLDPRIRLD